MGCSRILWQMLQIIECEIIGTTTKTSGTSKKFRKCRDGTDPSMVFIITFLSSLDLCSVLSKFSESSSASGYIDPFANSQLRYNFLCSIQLMSARHQLGFHTGEQRANVAEESIRPRLLREM